MAREGNPKMDHDVRNQYNYFHDSLRRLDLDNFFSLMYRNSNFNVKCMKPRTYKYNSMAKYIQLIQFEKKYFGYLHYIISQKM